MESLAKVRINLQRRNKDTLQANDIEKDIDEYFESFTYFYMFFENINGKKIVTIAFLKSQGAPNIRKLNLLTNLTNDPANTIEIEPIISKDGLSILLGKDIINSIEYEIALPCDDIIYDEYFGLDEDEFDDFQNVKNIKLNFVIKGKKGKNILKDKNTIIKIRDKVADMFKNKKINSYDYTADLTFSAKAKDEEETLLTYDFMDNKFISKAKFRFELVSSWENEVKVIMHKKYMEKRKELIISLR